MKAYEAHALAATLSASTGRKWRKVYHFTYAICSACGGRHLSGMEWYVTDGVATMWDTTEKEKAA